MISTSKSAARTLAPRTYRELIARFPLRPLHDEGDYDNALDVAESVVGLSGLTDDQADYLDVLTGIIQKYENLHHPIESGATPLQILEQLLREHGLTGSDLGRLLGNRPLGSAILRGERELSKAHIRTRATHFKVSTDLLMGAP